MAIKKIEASEIFNCRGDPTLEVRVFSDNFFVRSSVPSNVNINSEQARRVSYAEKHAELQRAIRNINYTIAPKLERSRLIVTQQREIDNLLNDLIQRYESHFCVKECLGISVACCKAGAVENKMPLYKYIYELKRGQSMDTFSLPVPRFNMISGGQYTGNKLTFQEYAIIPTDARNFAEALNMASKVYQHLEKNIIEEVAAEEEIPAPINGRRIPIPVPITNEGSFVPNLKNDINAIYQLLLRSIEDAGYKCRIHIALDIAASAFYKEGRYDLQFKTQNSDPANYLTSADLKNQYLRYMIDFQSIISLKDPFAENDWDGWRNFIDQQAKIQVVCDDLTAMGTDKITEALNDNVATCLVLRISQSNTVTDIIDCAKKASEKNWTYIVSASLGETEDTFIADMAIGLEANQFSAGAPCRERMAKYNRILAIEQELAQNTGTKLGKLQY